MLAALIIWSYLALVLYLYGISAVWLLKRWLGEASSVSLGLPVVVLIGLVALGTLSTALSLFIGLGWLAALIILLAGLLSYALSRPPFPWKLRAPLGAEWLGVVVLFIAALIILVNATRATSNPDTNLYHAQTIHWVETYRAVPGLGNLNGRLAYNSDWLVLNAATSFAFVGLRSFHLIAGFLFLVAVLYFGEALFRLRREPALLSGWLKLLFLVLAFRILGGEISSPGTDLPVILITWVLACLAAEYVEGAAAVGSIQPVLLAVLPAFIVTLKLSAAPLMLVSAWMLIVMLAKYQSRRALVTGLLLLGIFLPWIARSVILSGYLVFPISRLDVFNFDWKIPASYVDSVRNGVIGWARQPNKDWTQTIRMPVSVWLPGWFTPQTPNQRLIIIAAVLSPLCLLLRGMRKYLLPVIINFMGIVFWVLSAPNLRFGYGFLLAGVAFLIGAVLTFAAARLPDQGTRRMSTAAAVILMFLLVYTFSATLDAGSLQERLVLPVDYSRFRTVSCSVGDLQLSCASAYKQCGYASFPCVPNVPLGVLPRGPALQDGFYSTK